MQDMIIKARVWDVEGEAMLYPHGLYFSWLRDGSLQGVDLDGIKGSIFDEPEWNTKFKVMLFSGLIDSMQQDIFLGDIVEHHQIIPSKGIDNLLGVYIVAFEQGRFVFHDPKRPEISGHYITPGSLKVVGNIYKTPELVA